MTGAELRAARLALGRTQMAMAERLGVNEKTVRRWEAERCRVPEAVAMLLWYMRNQSDDTNRLRTACWKIVHILPGSDVARALETCQRIAGCALRGEDDQSSGKEGGRESA